MQQSFSPYAAGRPFLNNLKSGDGYRQKEIILHNIETVKKNLPLNGSIEMKSTPHGKYFFNAKGNYGQLAGSSIEFESPELRNKWLRDIEKLVKFPGSISNQVLIWR